MSVQQGLLAVPRLNMIQYIRYKKPRQMLQLRSFCFFGLCVQVGALRAQLDAATAALEQVRASMYFMCAWLRALEVV